VTANKITRTAGQVAHMDRLSMRCQDVIAAERAAPTEAHLAQEAIFAAEGRLGTNGPFLKVHHIPRLL
jgi:hypothetical protein